jgi:hypothetical protein
MRSVLHVEVLSPRSILKEGGDLVGGAGRGVRVLGFGFSVSDGAAGF